MARRILRLGPPLRVEQAHPPAMLKALERERRARLVDPRGAGAYSRLGIAVTLRFIVSCASTEKRRSI